MNFNADVNFDKEVYLDEMFLGGNDGYSDNKGGAGQYCIKQKYPEIRGAN